MTRARDVADRGWHLSPRVVSNQDLTGVDIFSNPVSFPIQPDHTYRIRLMNLAAANAGGNPVLKFGTDTTPTATTNYRYTRTTNYSGSNGWVTGADTAANYWWTGGFLQTESDSVSAEILVTIPDAAEYTRPDYITRAAGWKALASVNGTFISNGGGYAINFLDTYTHMWLTAPSSTVLSHGRLLVYETPLT